MSEPFLGEIRVFPYNFAPRGWALCNGQLLPIAQNTALFSLFGTTYGGDGRVTFALPNLQGAAPMHAGQGPGLTDRFLGEPGGSDTVTLTSGQMPAHTHTMACVSANASATAVKTPANTTVFGKSQARATSTGYVTVAAQATAIMNANAVQLAGGSQPHNNMSPYVVFNICVALQGIFRRVAEESMSDAPRWSQRPVRPDDEPFLDQLYESTRWDEVLGWGLAPAQARTFLRSQAGLQRRSYGLQVPAAEHRVLLADDRPAGRLILGRAGGVWTVLDVAVLPMFRCRGLGTWALTGVLRAAADSAGGGAVVRLQVDPENPARRLYERLGFRSEAPPPGDGDADDPAAAAPVLRMPMAWRATPPAD